MKTVTIYEANDGSRHETQMECMEHEALLCECQIAESPLGPRPENLDDWEFVQHTRQAFDSARSNILRILRSRYDWAVLNNPDSEIHHGCIIGRLLDDSRNPLQRSWSRLGRISTKTFREYNQQYFANNESERQ